jgi:hypothetical protein
MYQLATREVAPTLGITKTTLYAYVNGDRTLKELGTKLLAVNCHPFSTKDGRVPNKFYRYMVSDMIHYS